MLNEEQKQFIAKQFYENNAVKKGTFKLSSGKESDLYIDTRLVSMSPSLYWICAYMGATLRENDHIKPDISLGAVPLGGIPIVGGMMVMPPTFPASRGFFWRDTQKQHGTLKCYEGHMEKKVVLIDDVATSGGSLIKVIDSIRQFDHKVEILAAYVVVDRLEGAKEALASCGIPLYSMITREDFF